jgi:hypothetical protein
VLKTITPHDFSFDTLRYVNISKLLKDKFEMFAFSMGLAYFVDYLLFKSEEKYE